MNDEVGWSLAQAVGWILEQRTGILQRVDAATSIAMLWDVNGDGPLPARAAKEAEDELLAKFLSGDVRASAQRNDNGELVDIPAREWMHLRITYAFDSGGDRLERRIQGRSYWPAYHDVRLDPNEIRRTWPHLQRGQRPQLRIVGGADLLAVPAPPVEVPKHPLSTPVKRGTKPRYDWTAFTAELGRLIEYEGEPSASTDPTWTQACIESRMMVWCATAWGREPAISTVRSRVSKYLASL